MLARAVVSAVLIIASLPVSATVVDRYAMSISGGISLGAYDAGRNWVFLQHLRYLRDHKQKHQALGAVTGASAGAINAFVTALSWCTEENAFPLGNSAGENAYRKLWRGMTFETLLPAAPNRTEVDWDAYIDNTLHGHRDGALARTNATRDIIKDLHTWFKSPTTFIPNCRVPLGLAVTRVEPLQHRVFDGVDYTLPVQTLYLSIELIVGDKDSRGRTKAHLIARPVIAGQRTVKMGGRQYHFDGMNLLLPRDGDDEIEFEQMKEVLFASSAFPIAFGRVYIDHCVPPDSVSASLPDSRCDHEYQLVNAAFVDGGVMDNVPIGLALALGGSDDAELGFFYIDPNIRRGWEKESQTALSASEPQYGLADQLAFLGGTYAVFDTANRARPLRELCGTDGSDGSPCGNRAIVATRKQPIVGEMAGHFAAFFDTRFADYDYAVGVYDGLYALAKIDSSNSDPIAVGESLGLDDESETWNLVRMFSGESATISDDMRAIHDALDKAQNRQQKDCVTMVPVEDRPAIYFSCFAKELKPVEGFSNDNWLLEDAMRRSDAWYLGIGRLATSRLRRLETEAKSTDDGDGGFMASLLQKGIAWADIYTQEAASPPGWDLNPTVNPRLSWLPYQVGVEVREVMVQVNWLPKWRGEKWQVEMPFGVIVEPGRAPSSSQAMGGVNLQFPFGSNQTWRTGVGYRLYYDFDPGGRTDRVFDGGAIYIEGLGRARLELTYRDTPWRREWLLTVLANDFPALWSRYRPGRR